jgi:hypothetical protein
MREKRKQRLKERSLNKQAKGMAAAIEGKGGKSRRLLKRAGKLMKKASRDSKDPYSDKVYTINKGLIGEKRGERILKKAKKKGDVREFDSSGGGVEITKGSKGRKTVTKYKGKESGTTFYELKKEGTKGQTKRAIKKSDRLAKNKKSDRLAKKEYLSRVDPHNK